MRRSSMKIIVIATLFAVLVSGAVVYNPKHNCPLGWDLVVEADINLTTGKSTQLHYRCVEHKNKEKKD